MRQIHRAGKKLFADFAGDTVPIVDAGSGEIRRAHIFVAVLGASNYTYACATGAETQADWLGSIARALSFIGGVTEGKVEVGVLIVQRWVLARLRNRRFFSLAELDAAIGELLENLNGRPFRKLSGCRRSAFETLDRPVLRPRPVTPFQLARWKKAKVNIDNHVTTSRSMNTTTARPTHWCGRRSMSG